ncbi:MAG: crossover junction endodeoxyribonuclease RuvC [Legionellales bacterium]|jgi:crossover junction endodeoxyribonuclease RuvC|nr:crossover junction endodeoxyribonuclease RuvC [Legionellales bacterium]
MIVLGFDPGSQITGYGIIRHLNNKSTYIASGCIRLPKVDMPSRLLQLHQAARQIIEQYSPDVTAIEKVFVKNNVDSALKLGQARGVLLCAMAEASSDIFEYSPREIKQAVVGYGGADKAQVQTMVQSLLSLSKKPQADAADALAVAICHVNTNNFLLKLKG